MTAVSLGYRLNCVVLTFSAAPETVMLLKRFAKAHPVLKHPHGGHQDFLRPCKQCLLLAEALFEMEGDKRATL